MVRRGKPPRPSSISPPTRDRGVTLVTPALVAYAHEHNIAIMTWVVDDEATLARLVNMHVDGI